MLIYFTLTVSCAPGTYNGPPRLSMTEIGEGRFIAEEMPVCLECPVGTHQQGKGTTQCTRCPEFTSTLSAEAKNASACIGECLCVCMCVCVCERERGINVGLYIIYYRFLPSWLLLTNWPCTLPVMSSWILPAGKRIHRLPALYGGHLAGNLPK